MAEPRDAAIALQDASEIVQEQYMETYFEQFSDRFGATLNKVFQPDPEVVVGDGKTMQYEIGPADTVRINTDALGDIAYPQRIDPGSIKIRWNQSTPSSHDFTQVTAACQFDIYTIENGSEGTVVDLAERIYNKIQDDYNEKLAIFRRAGRTAQLALVNGTPRQDNLNDYDDCTASATNSTDMRIKVDSGSIATIRPNSRYDFLSSAGVVHAGNLRCVDIPNYDDLSAAFEYVSSGPTGELSTGLISDVADNDLIVFSGTYNKGMYSFGAYFSAPTEGESFIAGVDRTDKGRRWMNPQRIAAGGAALAKTHFNRMAIAMGFFGDNARFPVGIISDPTQHQVLRDELGEDAFVEYPVGDARAARFANFGSIGLNYQHPTFGTIKILSDPLATPTQIEFFVNGTWKMLSYGWKGLKTLPGDGGGNSHWYRMNQSTPNTGRGLIMKADWVGNVCDFGTMPWKNGVLTGLATASV